MLILEENVHRKYNYWEKRVKTHGAQSTKNTVPAYYKYGIIILMLYSK
jgi:hypothetical protein